MFLWLVPWQPTNNTTNSRWCLESRWSSSERPTLIYTLGVAPTALYKSRIYIIQPYRTALLGVGLSALAVLNSSNWRYFKKKVGKSRHLSPSTTLKFESIHGKSRTKFMFSCLKTSDVCLNLHYFSVVIFTILPENWYFWSKKMFFVHEMLVSSMKWAFFDDFSWICIVSLHCWVYFYKQKNAFWRFFT